MQVIDYINHITYSVESNLFIAGWPSALVKATSQQFHDWMIAYKLRNPIIKNWKQLVISA